MLVFPWKTHPPRIGTRKPRSLLQLHQAYYRLNQPADALASHWIAHRKRLGEYKLRKIQTWNGSSASIQSSRGSKTKVQPAYPEGPVCLCSPGTCGSFRRKEAGTGSRKLRALMQVQYASYRLSLAHGASYLIVSKSRVF